MNRLIDSAWRLAEERSRNAQLDGDGFYMYRLDDTDIRGIFGGIEADGSLLLAVETLAPPPSIDLRSEAIDYFRRRRKEQNTWLLVVRLKRPDLNEVFSALSDDLINAVSGVESDQEAISLFSTRLRLWQKLFEGRSSGLLADHEIKGLTAELLHLRGKLADESRGSEELIHAWLGPTGADQDFIFSDSCVEVKAIGPNSEVVSISSLQQLHSPLPIQLCVWTLRRAAPGETSAWSLNQLVLDIEQRLHASPGALSTFRDRLLSAGYVGHSFYERVVFEPMREETFPVGDAFPKLTESMVPKGVHSAAYAISLHEIRSSQQRLQHE